MIRRRESASCSSRRRQANFLMAQAKALPRWTRGAALAFLLFLPACARGQAAGAVPAPIRADTALLRHTLDSLADTHHGVVGSWPPKATTPPRILGSTASSFAAPGRRWNRSA